MQVVFRIKSAETQFGSVVHIIGNKPFLGQWNTQNSVKMETNDQLYPTWQTKQLPGAKDKKSESVSIPLQISSKDEATNIEYKYLIKNCSQGLKEQWEVGSNRKIDLRQYIKKSLQDGQIIVIEDKEFDVVTKPHVSFLQKEIEDDIDEIAQKINQKHNLIKNAAKNRNAKKIPTDRGQMNKAFIEHGLREQINYRMSDKLSLRSQDEIARQMGQKISQDTLGMPLTSSSGKSGDSRQFENMTQSTPRKKSGLQNLPNLGLNSKQLFLKKGNKTEQEQYFAGSGKPDQLPKQVVQHQYRMNKAKSNYQIQQAKQSHKEKVRSQRKHQLNNDDHMHIRKVPNIDASFDNDDNFLEHEDYDRNPATSTRISEVNPHQRHASEMDVQGFYSQSFNDNAGRGRSKNLLQNLEGRNARIEAASFMNEHEQHVTVDYNSFKNSFQHQNLLEFQSQVDPTSSRYAKLTMRNETPNHQDFLMMPESKAISPHFSPKTSPRKERHQTFPDYQQYAVQEQIIALTTQKSERENQNERNSVRDYQGVQSSLTPPSQGSLESNLLKHSKKSLDSTPGTFSLTYLEQQVKVKRHEMQNNKIHIESSESQQQNDFLQDTFNGGASTYRDFLDDHYSNQNHEVEMKPEQFSLVQKHMQQESGQQEIEDFGSGVESDEVRFCGLPSEYRQTFAPSEQCDEPKPFDNVLFHKKGQQNNYHAENQSLNDQDSLYNKPKYQFSQSSIKQKEASPSDAVSQRSISAKSAISSASRINYKHQIVKNQQNEVLTEIFKPEVDINAPWLTGRSIDESDSQFNKDLVKNMSQKLEERSSPQSLVHNEVHSVNVIVYDPEYSEPRGIDLSQSDQRNIQSLQIEEQKLNGGYGQYNVRSRQRSRSKPKMPCNILTQPSSPKLKQEVIYQTGDLRKERAQSKLNISSTSAQDPDGNPSKRSKSERHMRKKSYGDETFGFVNGENSGVFILPQLDSSEAPQYKNKTTKAQLNITTATGVLPMKSIKTPAFDFKFVQDNYSSFASSATDVICLSKSSDQEPKVEQPEDENVLEIHIPEDADELSDVEMIQNVTIQQDQIEELATEIEDGLQNKQVMQQSCVEATPYMIQPFAFLSSMRMLRLNHSFANKSALVNAIQNNKQAPMNTTTVKTDEEPPEIKIDSDILRSESQESIVIPTEDHESFIVFEEDEQPQQFQVVEDANFSHSPDKKQSVVGAESVVDNLQLFNNSGANIDSKGPSPSVIQKVKMEDRENCSVEAINDDLSQARFNAFPSYVSEKKVMEEDVKITKAKANLIYETSRPESQTTERGGKMHRQSFLHQTSEYQRERSSTPKNKKQEIETFNNDQTDDEAEKITDSMEAYLDIRDQDVVYSDEDRVEYEDFLESMIQEENPPSQIARCKSLTLLQESVNGEIDDRYEKLSQQIEDRGSLGNDPLINECLFDGNLLDEVHIDEVQQLDDNLILKNEIIDQVQKAPTQQILQQNLFVDIHEVVIEEEDPEVEANTSRTQNKSSRLFDRPKFSIKLASKTGPLLQLSQTQMTNKKIFTITHLKQYLLQQLLMPEWVTEKQVQLIQNKFVIDEEWTIEELVAYQAEQVFRQPSNEEFHSSTGCIQLKYAINIC